MEDLKGSSILLHQILEYAQLSVFVPPFYLPLLLFQQVQILLKCKQIYCQRSFKQFKILSTFHFQHLIKFIHCLFRYEISYLIFHFRQLIKRRYFFPDLSAFHYFQVRILSYLRYPHPSEDPTPVHLPRTPQSHAEVLEIFSHEADHVLPAYL